MIIPFRQTEINEVNRASDEHEMDGWGRNLSDAVESLIVKSQLRDIGRCYSTSTCRCRSQVVDFAEVVQYLGKL